MSATRELAWKRDSWSGCWLATDSAPGNPVYSVWRDPDAPRGHQWTLSVELHLDDATQTQTRIGFDLKYTAQVAALATRCHACGRFAPFATLEQSGSARMGGWRCRDQETCVATGAAKVALAAEVIREIRNTDLEKIGVADTADGPELAFTRAGTGNKITIECTENDLLRLAVTLLDRWRVRPGFPGALADDIGRASLGLKNHYEDRAGIPWRMS
jgi:hypothetical protein